MAETKADKADILAYMKAWGDITPYDLVDQFGFTLAYARKRLTMLKKQGLAADSRSSSSVSRGCWAITTKGEARGLYFHEKGLCSQEWCRHSGEHGSANARSAEKQKSAEEQKAAYKQGYKEAESHYKISYGCSICGRQVDIDTAEEKEFAKLYMEHDGWAHARCIGEESGRKASITAISNRLRLLIEESRILTNALKNAPKYGIRPEQINKDELYAIINEIRKLFSLLPANEQMKFLKK
jgi:hypothetical protein